MVKITEETMKNRINNFMPGSHKCPNALSEAIEKAERTNSLEGYKRLLAEFRGNLKKDLLSAVATGEDIWDALHSYVWNLENLIGDLEEFREIKNNFAYRKEIKEKLVEDNAGLLSKLNSLNQFFSLEAKLNELETAFEQQVKPLKSSWSTQIKNKKNEITNILHRGKGNTGSVREEISELEKKLADYKELVQKLQKARSIIDDSGARELTGASDHLNSSLQKLQEEDNNKISADAYQIIEEARKEYRKIKRNCERVERVSEERKNELENCISQVQELTQKLLLDNQQFQSYQGTSTFI
jgi:hypothetical protein